MPTRREVMDRAEARLLARGGGEAAIEASRCFLRAMLASIDESAPVPFELVARINELLAIDVGDNGPATVRRIGGGSRFPGAHAQASSVTSQAEPVARRRRVLFVGRSDGARLAMFEAVGRAALADEADVRAASLMPVAMDARALRVLRHAGYPTAALVARAVTVDDLSWADLVVTTGGERETWERFLPRSSSHRHEGIEDPVVAASTPDSGDELEYFRLSLRAIERAVALLRSPRAARFSAPPSVRPK